MALGGGNMTLGGGGSPPKFLCVVGGDFGLSGGGFWQNLGYGGDPPHPPH